MSLPFDISEKLKSVQVRHYVEWLGRDSHCGYGFAFGYDEKSYRLIDELFQMLQDVETDDEDGAKELWLCARRGTIDDFAKQYGTYEENLEDGTVKNQKEYEDYWKSEFPDEVEWYRFVAVEHTDIKYRCVFLSNKQVLEMDKRLESGYTHDISEFTEWLVDAVKLTIEAVRNGTYNESVARLLPYKHRTGVITRAGLWKLYPEEKESFFEALTQEDVDEFLATGTEDCTGLPELKEMTANHPLSEMERVPAEELPKRLDELFDRMDKENVGFVVTEEGKDSCVFCPYKWFELEYETIEVAVDEVLLAQIKEIITPLGWTVERLIVRFLEWLVDPETQEEAIAWLMKAKEELGEK